MTYDQDNARYRSRKFLLATGSFVVVSVLALFTVYHAALAKDFSGAAMVMTAWGAADAAILKLYNDANLKAKGGDQ